MKTQKSIIQDYSHNSSLNIQFENQINNNSVQKGNQPPVTNKTVTFNQKVQIIRNNENNTTNNLNAENSFNEKIDLKNQDINKISDEMSFSL